MGIKSFIAGGFFLLLSHSQAFASQVTVFGPQTFVPKINHSHPVDFSFAGLTENSSSVVTLKMGDGTDLSPKSCGGKSLVLAKCKIENVLRGLEVFLTRPQSIDLSLNGQVLVSRTNYNAAAGTMLISTTTKVANSLKVLTSREF